jgi:hypothetical protein
MQPVSRPRRLKPKNIGQPLLGFRPEIGKISGHDVERVPPVDREY